MPGDASEPVFGPAGGASHFGSVTTTSWAANGVSPGFVTVST